ncbi:hypothetical protein QA648_27510 (plasmid) [Rhizobium sp. CB3171]|uniref:hypothetical protein n=1 Tax=Rhizobium sp. CB3171 TaxID=3039157 RepID=UPI0024B0F3EF|nr:hypothetical protein [Rhizobium sp. CB3171]WFU04531.1 hypothetical protein QA648_27510 [Rhizobium sp. CB3171]
MAISKRKAWCNNEVAYITWEIDERIDGLLGFMIVRLHQDGEKRLLPTWVAFKGQSNPKWQPQDTSVWPVQKFEWRDLTLRRSRDKTSARAPFTCRYQIWPVGLQAEGRKSVAAWRTENPDVFSSFNRENFTGQDVPLYLCGDPAETNDVTPRLDFKDFKVAFTNGILSTQNLRQQLNTPEGKAPNAALLRDQHTKVPGDNIRQFLSGDVLPTITGFFDNFAADDQAYAALYELTDEELIGKLTGLGHRLHLILSTAGDATKTNPAWDTENHKARETLHGTAGEMIDRLFNTTSRIGHNKFVVQVGADGKAKAVLTGSTNFTDTGLCTQSNNAIISTSADLANAYLEYWQRLKADTATFPTQKDTSLPNHNVQQHALRDANSHAYLAPDVLAPTSVRLWCSPNTAATSKTKTSPTPADLTDVFALMRAAKQAILFLTFMPSPEGSQSIVEMAVELGKEDSDLLVLGAISSPLAMPNYVPSTPGGPKLPAPAVFSPEGAPKVLTIRAAAIGAHYGDFEPELLSAGFAIIHDKIVVIDPFSANCAVITGSHNLGFKASLLICTEK